MNIIAQKKNLGVLYINSALKMSALTQVKGIDQKSKVPNVVKSNGAYYDDVLFLVPNGKKIL